MKALYNYLVLLLLIVINTSCLKAGLDDLETYNQNDITNIRFEYRWWDESGKRLRVIEMGTEKTIDNNAKEIVCSIKVPDATQTFTTEIRNQVSLSTLAINVDASSSARISPVGGAARPLPPVTRSKGRTASPSLWSWARCSGFMWTARPPSPASISIYLSGHARKNREPDRSPALLVSAHYNSRKRHYCTQRTTASSGRRVLARGSRTR